MNVAYSTPAVDFRALNVMSVCMISVDVQYERKKAGSYDVKANSFQEFCLEVVGGVEGAAMAQLACVPPVQRDAVMEAMWRET